MRDARGKYLQPYNPEYFNPIIETDYTERNAERIEGKTVSSLLTPLQPIRDLTSIVGVDVSGIRIGETETGVLCAVRGAIVWNENRRYRYLRLGPFPFHVTEENKRDIFRIVEQKSFNCPPLFEAQIRLCNIIERWVQLNISRSSKESILLWDGSLSSGSPGSSTSMISRILGEARRNSNCVLSFSKTTTVRFLGKKITNLVSKQKPPCLFEVEDLPLSISKSAHLLGKIYVAKLTNRGCSFRVDIDSMLPTELRIISFQKLLGNEIMYQGYPETLRLAHILSTFTGSDVMGMQRFIAQNYGLRIDAQPDIRKALFGPYGTGFGD